MGSIAKRMAAFAILALLVVSNHGEAANNPFSCIPVVASLTPCINYLVSGGALSIGCCNGIKRISKAANNTSSRQASCDCIKKTVSSIPGLKAGRLPPIPSKCQVQLPFPVSLDMDCSKVI